MATILAHMRKSDCYTKNWGGTPVRLRLAGGSFASLVRSTRRQEGLTLRWSVCLAVVASLLLPAGAFAWTVTVHVHGAGKVVETTPRALMNCTVGPTGKSESSVTDCVAGTPGGVYNSFDVVNLQASVPQDSFDRGWRFAKYVDSGAGGGQINCDPQGTTGDHFDVDCQFQIFENLQTHLYFDDVAGPQDTAVSSGPPAATNATTATLNFDAASDPDAVFECRLDRPGQAPGASSHAAVRATSPRPTRA